MVCHCSWHKQGCGCLSKTFIEKARNYFSLILSRSEFAKEFATRLKGLAMHAHNKHDWGFGRCDFHEHRVCSYGECEDGKDLKCEGKDYHTRHACTDLSFPLWCTLLNAMREQKCLNSWFTPFLRGGIPIDWRPPTTCSFASDQSTSSSRGCTMCIQLSWLYCSPICVHV